MSLYIPAFTGYSRKKRAPPPPQTQQVKDDRVKSSTLPSSIAEEMRNGFSFMTESFTSAKVDEDDDIPEESFDNAKVQIPVEVTSRVVIETKATVEEPAVRAGKQEGKEYQIALVFVVESACCMYGQKLKQKTSADPSLKV